MSEIKLLPHQYDFVNMSAKYNLLIGGIGCIHESTLIETINGKKSVLDIKQDDAYYKSFNGIGFNYQRGTVPFLKGKGNLYRVIHEQGEFVAYGSHLVFSSNCEYQSVDNFFFLQKTFGSCSYLLPTIEESYQKALFLNVSHCLKKLQDFLIYYLAYNRLNGELPLLASGICLDNSPQLSDVLKFYQCFYLWLFERKDDLRVQVLSSTHREYNVYHASMMDSSNPLVDQLLIVVNQISTLLFECILPDNQSSLIFHKMNEFHRINFLLNQCHIFFSSNTNTAFNKIVSIEKLKEDYYFDLQVFDTNNYVAEGVIHHNSGKSVAGGTKSLRNISLYPHATGSIFANTYRQLMNATLASFFRSLNDLQIPFSFNQQKGVLQVINTKILCLSLENFDVHRGIEIGWGWIDEVQDIKEEAFQVISGRLRDSRGPLQLDLTGSAKGFNWVYKKFAGKDRNEDFKYIKAKTKDNKHLPESYIRSLYGQYSSKFAQQELEAEFVEIASGRIYYAYDRDVHVRELKDFNGQIYIGMDFNVNPMTAVIAKVNNNSVYVFDEIYLEHSHTKHACLELIKKGYKGCRIIPDFTGRAMKTSGAGVSDLMILEDYGFKIEGSGNPLRMDRYNSVNKLLEENNLIISPSCVNLISDIPLVSYEEGKNTPNTDDKMVGHISDALGYLVWGTIGLGKKHQANRQHQF